MWHTLATGHELHPCLLWRGHISHFGVYYKALHKSRNIDILIAPRGCGDTSPWLWDETESDLFKPGLLNRAKRILQFIMMSKGW